MSALQKWDEPRPVKLTIADFLCLDEAGAFRLYAKTELIGGKIVAMNAQYSLHADVKGQIFRRLANACEAVSPTHRVWTEVSVAVPPSDLPEPDIVIASFAPSARAPVPSETVMLLVEVADTTARYDLGEKANLYAAAGIPEYWVADLPAGLVHQMWGPTAEGYTEYHRQAMGTVLQAVTLPVEIKLPDIAGS